MSFTLKKVHLVFKYNYFDAVDQKSSHQMTELDPSSTFLVNLIQHGDNYITFSIVSMKGCDGLWTVLLMLCTGGSFLVFFVRM